MSDLGAKLFWGFMAILMVIVALFLNNEEVDCNLLEIKTLKECAPAVWNPDGFENQNEQGDYP